jgi:uncharacterized paraquat-inducible protein A
MMPAVVLTFGSLALAAVGVLVASRLGLAGLAAPVFGGLVGPLAAVVATWIAVVRAFRRDPVSVMGVMIKAFMVKALFFVGYVVAMIKVAGLSAPAFGASFVACFIVLYAIEALLFSRLFGRALGEAR